MSREIKFRVFVDRKMEYFELGEAIVDRKGRIVDFGSVLIMQFTGLQDKNGKEIYEGDILKRSKEPTPSFVAVIEFKHGMFGGTTKPGNNHFIEMIRLPRCDHGGTGYDEIIGNLFENPELLTTK